LNEFFLGWAAAKLKARRDGIDDSDLYVSANQDSKSLILTLVWATGILSLFGRILQVQVLDK
jgi:hypothetical protein